MASFIIKIEQSKTGFDKYECFTDVASFGTESNLNKLYLQVRQTGGCTSAGLGLKLF